MGRHRGNAAAGFSLPELLVAITVLGLLAALCVGGGHESLARQRLEAALRRLDQGIQRARAEAQQRGQPCGLSLRAGPDGTGWGPPGDGSLPPCQRSLEALQEPIGGGAVQVEHNLPAVLRFTANGLVLDAGTVVLRTAGTDLRRCLVMALPLGITRLGRERGEGCEADAQL
jgi:prepilin-type N-terminal cleavage/methylation domain-containing protein